MVRIVRAAVTDLMEWRRAQGASTLTQQLSKRLFLTPEKSFRRKVQEALMAIQIERYFTKPQIFTMYANQVDLGHGNFGYEAAAQFYFGKHLEQLTLPEAALLAGIPKSPTAYSPLTHPEAFAPPPQSSAAGHAREWKDLAGTISRGGSEHPSA